MNKINRSSIHVDKKKEGVDSIQDVNQGISEFLESFDKYQEESYGEIWTEAKAHAKKHPIKPNFIPSPFFLGCLQLSNQTTDGIPIDCTNKDTIRESLSDKVSLTREEITQIGLKSLQSYAENNPSLYLNRDFLEL